MKLCKNQSHDRIKTDIVSGVVPKVIELLTDKTEGRSLRVVFQVIPDDIFGDFVEVFIETATPQPPKIERIEIPAIQTITGSQ